MTRTRPSATKIRRSGVHRYASHVATREGAYVRVSPAAMVAEHPDAKLQRSRGGCRRHKASLRNHASGGNEKGRPRKNGRHSPPAGAGEELRLVRAGRTQRMVHRADDVGDPVPFLKDDLDHTPPSHR